LSVTHLGNLAWKVPEESCCIRSID